SIYCSGSPLARGRTIEIRTRPEETSIMLIVPPAGLAQSGNLIFAQLDMVGAVAAAPVQAATGGAVDPFVFPLSIFVLAVFVGFYVVWSVTPALHTPLMSVTHPISSVIV